ncbi:MAG: hypothetical protein FWD72_05525, partial [Eggerthellaceae bacterium]|nr:hypothetical protein [Eggerthellaceae bacterium]
MRQAPALLPLLCVALGFWAGTAGAYLFAYRLVESELLICMLASLLPLAAAALAGRKAKKPLFQHLSLLVLGVALGLVCGFLGGAAAKARIGALQDEAYRDHCFEVTEDLREGSLGKVCTAQTTLADGQAIQVRLVFKDGTPDVGFGDLIDARCA